MFCRYYIRRNEQFDINYTKKPESSVFQYGDEWLSGFWCHKNSPIKESVSVQAPPFMAG